MFVNKKIKGLQKWKDWGEIEFEPDSSPEAWDHYKKFYLKSDSKFSIRSNYEFDELSFYHNYWDFKNNSNYNINSGYQKNGKWLNYVDLPLRTEKPERLFALNKNTNTKFSKYNCITYIEDGAYRYGGECDFNFNEKKVALFMKIIQDNNDAKIQLERCEKCHHKLLNFSLIQAVGNLQGYKGRNRFDRLDTFIFELNEYFAGKSANVLSAATEYNRSALIAYLNNFKDIYEYCREIYFIENETFVNEIVKQGSLPIATCDDVTRYMDLAEEFWDVKENHFLNSKII